MSLYVLPTERPSPTYQRLWHLILVPGVLLVLLMCVPTNNIYALNNQHFISSTRATLNKDTGRPLNAIIEQGMDLRGSITGAKPFLQEHLAPRSTAKHLLTNLRRRRLWSGYTTRYENNLFHRRHKNAYSMTMWPRRGVKVWQRKNSFASYAAYGKVIVISLSHQWLYAYQEGKQVFNAAVITGRPSLATPAGTYYVFAKLSPTTFYSLWPSGSPYWYVPTTVKHALEFKAGGFFIHDSYWHTVYGPGKNGWHHDPVYGWQWGSHGCVSMPDSNASWLYNWAPIGTTVRIS